MKLIIDIPEDTYQYYVKLANKGEQLNNLESIILDGTPLPKGHGRLIDANEVTKNIEALRDIWDCYGDKYEAGRWTSYDNALDEVIETPTIIEADEEE